MKASNEKYQNNDNRKLSWLQNFFILCSGADKDIIAECPTEWNKYAGIGATIFFTGLLASISGGYALFTIFRGDENAVKYALLFGILWGFVILNLDRFVVSSIRKEGNLKKELLQAAPRFILAIIISIVIAKPLEVRIFESRIEQQILEDKRQKLEDEKLSIDKLNDLTKLENQQQNQNSELGTLDSLRQGDPTSDDFKKLISDRNFALQDLNSVSKSNNPKIADYNFKISQVKGKSENYKEIKDSLGVVIDRKLNSEANKTINDLSYSRNILANEIKAKQKRVEDLDAQIQKARNDYQALMAQRINEKQAEIEQTKQTKSQADSIAKIQFDESVKIKERSYTNNFITQLEAMGNLTSKNSTMALTSWMIMLLFLVIETAPILVKVLSKRGPYDEKLDATEYEVYIGESQKIDNLNRQVNEYLKLANDAAKISGSLKLEAEKDKLDIELRNNKELLNKLADYQKELAIIYADAWFEEEKAKAIQQAKGLYHQANQLKPQPKLEDTLWKQKGATDKIEYFFLNGSLTDNELRYFENNQMNIGKWSFNNSKKDEISIDLLNNKVEYVIAEIKDTTLKLKDKATNDILEFEKG
jgi:hypothetical protein